MKWMIGLFLVLITSSFLPDANNLPHNLPRHLDLPLNWKEITKSDFAFIFDNPDTLLKHEMFLLKNEQASPLLYYSEIQTPVCIDGVCKPVYIEMYWDLVGKYVGYGIFPAHLLTKFDHEAFTSTDYLKLHNLLLDPHSILDRRSLSDLYEPQKKREKTITFNGEEIDGISGATKKEIKNSIVAGALYSCYTLWQLAQTKATQKINVHLSHIYNDTLENHFLQSNRVAYQMYALKQLSSTDYSKKKAMILAVLKKGNPLTRAYILKKTPKSLFRHPLFIQQIFGNFSDLDLNTKTLLVRNLTFSSPEAARQISSQINQLSTNQLKQFLEILENHPLFNTKSVKENLKKYAVDKQSAYFYLINTFLNAER